VTQQVVTSLDLRTIHKVLEMEGGYVLDPSDQTFRRFFEDFGVNINDPKYSADGPSKAKRLRQFLRITPPPLSGRVLAGLLQHRLASSSHAPQQSDLDRYEEVVVRLGGQRSRHRAEPAREEASEADLLQTVFDQASFSKLPLEDALAKALVERMEEAQRCIAAKSYLAAVILSGSVLEGMCLGFGSRYPEKANRGYATQYKKEPPAFHDWKLKEWIEVLSRLDALSPNVSKFGHALRDFRNYVHPAEQLAHRFNPDAHTARIAFHVVLAAVDDLLRATGRTGAA
jgi:hypothetical protein